MAMAIGVMMKRMVVFVLLVSFPAVLGALSVGFYDATCPSAETLVQQAVARAVANNPGFAPGLIRLHFHDCFVEGCDASVLLEGNDTERTAPPNNPSLRGFEVVDAAKTALETACPGIVSCADILAFAARDSAALAGNITWQVPAGRRDGNVSKFDRAVSNLPRFDFNSSELIKNFAAKNLTAIDMVTLSGAHSIGRAFCDTFSINRLYNFSNTGGIDPTLSSAYADLLRAKCPENVTLASNITVSLDILTPTVLDNRYYLGLENNVGLLTSDHALMTDPTLRSAVRNNSGNGAAWAELFRQAMIKMGNIEVKEGTQGEIRRKCGVVNSRISSTSGFDDNRYLASS